MPSDWQVKKTQSISWQGVSTTLKDNSLGLVSGKDFIHNRFERELEAEIINTIVQREVDWVVLTFFHTHIVNASSSWEEVPKFVEARSHDSVGCVEGFFYPISMVAVDVNIEHALITSQKLQTSQHTVVHITKARCLLLFGMVKPACPIDCYVTLLVYELLNT